MKHFISRGKFLSLRSQKHNSNRTSLKLTRLIRLLPLQARIGSKEKERTYSDNWSCLEETLSNQAMLKKQISQGTMKKQRTAKLPWRGSNHLNQLEERNLQTVSLPSGCAVCSMFLFSAVGVICASVSKSLPILLLSDLSNITGSPNWIMVCCWLRLG